MPPRRFNALCLRLGLVWLVTAPILSIVLWRGVVTDFEQYYMGAVMVARGQADDMYPVPRPDATCNAGWEEASTMRPRYAAVAAEVGVGDENRWILPPPTAMALLPLAVLPLEAARWTWVLLMGVCVWFVAAEAGRWHDRLAGRETRISGLVTLLIAFSPLALRTVRTGQITPLVAVFLALALHAVVRDRGARAGASLVAATFGKYAGVVLLPVLLLRRRWGAVAWFAGIGVGVLLASVAVVGVEPWRIWIVEIVPTLGRSSEFAGNQSLSGLLLRAFDLVTLPAALVVMLRAAFLLAVVALMLLARRGVATGGSSHAIATSAGVLLLLLVFSPIAWEHYFLYLAPFCGWLVWEALRGPRHVRVLVFAGLGLLSFPFAVLDGGRLDLPEPLGSHMLLGALLLIVVAVHRLERAAPIARRAGRRSEHAKAGERKGAELRDVA